MAQLVKSKARSTAPFAFLRVPHGCPRPPQGLHYELCRSAPDVVAAFERGSVMRRVGGTALNEKSSRSHTAFRFVSGWASI